MEDMINNKKNVSEFIFKNKDQKNIDNIFNNTFPILSATSEIHVSSFENDNYYDEGHTYFRAGLSSITSGKKDYKIHSKGPLSKNTVISFMSGYGTGFETEVIDFDYKNFSPNDITCFSSNTFLSKHKIVHGINVNYLALEDLGRTKYQIANIHSFVFNPIGKNNWVNLGENLTKKAEVIHSDSYQIG
tara:strand:+ start:267 stop:830 length:564 start_codon:yes stop_codon:yes gene_type:complete